MLCLVCKMLNKHIFRKSMSPNLMLHNFPFFASTLKSICKLSIAVTRFTGIAFFVAQVAQRMFARIKAGIAIVCSNIFEKPKSSFSTD